MGLLTVFVSISLCPYILHRFYLQNSCFLLLLLHVGAGIQLLFIHKSYQSFDKDRVVSYQTKNARFKCYTFFMSLRINLMFLFLYFLFEFGSFFSLSELWDDFCFNVQLETTESRHKCGKICQVCI